MELTDCIDSASIMKPRLNFLSLNPIPCCEMAKYLNCGANLDKITEMC